MSTLYELTAQYAELHRLLADGDIDDTTLEDTLESLALDEAIEEKVDGYVAVMSAIDADVEQIRAEEKRLADRRRTLGARRERMADHLIARLQLAGKPKLATALHTVTVAKPRASVEVTDIDAVPTQLKRVVTETVPDKRAIGDALKAGDDVPGARLVVGQPSLRIR